MQPFRGALTHYPVVSNLIIINILLLMATWVAERTFHIDLVDILGLHYPASSHFRPYQIVTHLFMHGGLTHLFFNMFALWMFGRILENQLGSKRFLFYYLFTGLGAAGVHTLVNYIEFSNLQSEIEQVLSQLTPETLSDFITQKFPQYYSIFYDNIISQWTNDPNNSQYISLAQDYFRQLLSVQMDIPTVGASGAVFGILLAFGMMFPNVTLYLIFPPIPIKAKWFVLIYGAIELYLGISQPGSSIAHFAHIGGMLFGIILILYWRRYGSRFHV
ncbi:MAG: rhomboid family intramembrane serine protease [Bacteroides sp.]